MSEEHNLIPFIDHQLTRLAGNADYTQMFQALTVAREAIIKAAPNDQWLGAVIPHDMTVTELRTQLANTEQKLRAMIDAEHRLSDAYIRIRELVGTINMTGPVWANTEEAVKKLVEQTAVAAPKVVTLPKSQRLHGNGYGYYFDMNDVYVALETAGIQFKNSEPERHPTGASPTCDHHWIASEGRTSSGLLCDKCGAYEVPDPEQPHARHPQFTNRDFAQLQADGCAPNDKPCVLCGVVSSHPEGWHYCKAKADE